MKICGIIKTSTVDYPGKIVTTVFLGGCNFDCEYCHNRELITPSKYTEIISKEEVFSFLKKRKGIIDGICISGGEPTLHGSKLIEFIKELKDNLGKDFLVKLDTNGSNPKFIKQIKDCVDYVALDYKALDYSKFSNTTRKTVLKTLEEIKKYIENYEVRLTMYPQYIKFADLPQIIEELKGVKKIYIQEYKPVEGASKERYTINELNQVVDAFKKENLECELRF